MTGGMLDLGELVKRAIKYLVEGLMVAIAAYAIPKKALNLDEVALIALTAAASAFFSSPNPIQLLADNAAASVTLTASKAKFLSFISIVFLLICYSLFL